MARGYLWVDLEWEIAEMFGDLSRVPDILPGDLADAVRREIYANRDERRGARARLGEEWWDRVLAHQRQGAAKAGRAARTDSIVHVVKPLKRVSSRRFRVPAKPTKYQLDYQRRKTMSAKIVKAPVATGIAKSVFHIASNGGAMAVCGAIPHGMFLLEPAEAKRATCDICISASGSKCPHCGGTL